MGGAEKGDYNEYGCTDSDSNHLHMNSSCSSPHPHPFFQITNWSLTHLAPDRPSPPALLPYRETPDRPVAAS